jgi:tetratricopeptide (TPR) repeat protein
MGHHLGTIVMPEQPVKITWGDKNFRALFITATSSVYRLRTKVRGFVPTRKRVRGQGILEAPWGREVSTGLCLILMCLSGVMLAADERAKAAAHADRGLEFARAGNLPMAESELRIAVEMQPRDAQFLSSFGTVLAMEGKLEESITVLTKALGIAPNDLTAHRYLAANLWQLHRYTAAKQHLDLILRQKPGDPATRLLRGMVAENTGDYSTAARMLASVPKQVRQQPESIVALARSYYHLGQQENARRTLDELSNHPSGPQAVFLGAQIADEMHDYDTAEKLLTSIQQTFPDASRLTYTKALIQYHNEQFSQCEQTLQQEIDAGRGKGEICNLLAWCYQKQNQTTNARRALEEGIRIEPSHETNYTDLTRILLANQLLPSALESAKKTTVKFPESSKAFELKGAVEAGMGQFRDAVESYSHAAQLDPSNVDSFLGLSDAQSAAGLTKEATASYEHGIRQFPKDARFPAHYASTLLRESELGNANARVRAKQLLQSSLKLDASLFESHYELGNLELNDGRMAQAVQHLERAVKLEPNSPAAHFALSRAYRRQRRLSDAARQLETYNRLKDEAAHNSEAAMPDVQPHE